MDTAQDLRSSHHGQNRALARWQTLVFVNSLILSVSLFTLMCLWPRYMSASRSYRWQDLERLPEAQLVYPGCVVTGRARSNAHRSWTDYYPTTVTYSCVSTDHERQIRLWYHNQLLDRGWRYDSGRGGVGSDGSFSFGWSRDDYHLSIFVAGNARTSAPVRWDQPPGQIYRYTVGLTASSSP